MPLTAAYGKALDYYAAGNWTESIQYLELSLRLHRLLKDSVRHCASHCNSSKHDDESFAGYPDLRVYWNVMMKATCQKKCRALFPAFQLPPPGREILEDFSRRSPYRYLHFAHSQVRQPPINSPHPFIQRYLQYVKLLCFFKNTSVWFGSIYTFSVQTNDKLKKNNMLISLGRAIEQKTLNGAMCNIGYLQIFHSIDFQMSDKNK